MEARGYWWQDGGFIKLTPLEYVQYNAGEGRMCLWFELSSPRLVRPGSEMTIHRFADRCLAFRLIDSHVDRIGC
jgi:hypothetical protein